MTLAQDRPTASAQPSPRVPARPARPSGPPPRPQLSSAVVPPWLEPADREPRPRGARIAVGLTLAAVVSAIVAVTAVAVDGSGLRQRLTDLATESDPTASEALVRSGVRTTLLVLLGGQVLLAVLLLLGSALFLRRRSWARWALVATAAVTVTFAALAQDVVAGGRDIDRLALLVEGGLLLLAMGMLVSRGVGTWLRSDDR